MARSDLLLALVKAGSSGDNTLFRKTVEAIVAEERGKKHEVLADRLEHFLRAAPTAQPHHQNGSLNGALGSVGKVSELWSERTPRRGYEELILPAGVAQTCAELVEEHLRADLLRSFNLTPRNRVLLAGAPGNGKTSLAEGLANALMAPLIVARYEGLIGSYLGETASRIKRLFDYARTRSCVLFFDEFDTVGKERGDEHETGEIKRVVSSLLLQIDDLPPHVVVVTATNHPELLDRAVWRRFQIRMELPGPSQAQAEEFLRRAETRTKLSFDTSLKGLADKLSGMSFAELDEFVADVFRRYVLTAPDGSLKKIVAQCVSQWQGRFHPPPPKPPPPPPMTTHPFLLFPKATPEKKGNLSGFGGRVVTPSASRQKDRLDDKFQGIVSAFDDLQNSVDGFEPERVIVFETLGDSAKEFAVAASRIKGMEWVAELDLGDQPGDEEFFVDGDPGKPLTARLYALMSNLAATRRLLALWRHWVDNPGQTAANGVGPFKDVFAHLKDIRRWGPADRIQETGILSAWEDDLRFAEERPGIKRAPVKFEVEMWCRANPALRANGYARLAALVTEAGGRCVSQCALPRIAYHGVLVELPAPVVRQTVEKIRAEEYTDLLRCDEVMFFRPRAQSMFPLGEEAKDASPAPPPPAPTAAQPVIAVLDGLPLANHTHLQGRVRIDDPDGFSTRYQPAHQKHGTAMCSLVLHGDLSAADTPLTQQLYVRPILAPVLDFDGQYRAEGTPDDVLLIDLFHRAIRRMFESEGGEPPAAPTVRVVNLSFGNPWQPFDRQCSPLARLLDWLAWKYRVLFLISAGNQNRDITISTPCSGWKGLSADELTKQVLLAMRADQAYRRPYSPAESLNAVTVGGWHEDGCPDTVTPHVDLFKGSSLPSPFGTVAAGFDQGVKPEVFFPAGRQLYRGPITPTAEPAKFVMVPGNHAPGLKVAAPGASPMELDRTYFSRGTSDATALATHSVGLIYERIQQYRQAGWKALTDAHLPVLLKALLVHGAAWGKEAALIESAIPPAELQGADGHRDWQKVQRILNRFIGCGKVDSRKAQFCTDERATILAWDSLPDGKSHLYSLPLPASLEGKKQWRRLTVTLAWFTPINPRHRNYRQALLWTDLGYDDVELADPNDKSTKKKTPREGKELLLVTKMGLDEKSSQRGTVQHRVWEGENASVYGGENQIRIRVSCKADAGKMTDAIPYGLAVSLEVAEGVGLPIFQEIKERILVPAVPVAPRSVG
ncbi:AAA family ATPase [Zavarzinella formosa]|uniref:AAA family ATPase n=1 Tax=Zavarzinella formosa TaxID=360055 RepID=UPI00031A75DE|nr:AAA family ATPase [Zavarzinella formosa]